MFDIARLIDLTDKLGLIQAVKTKLMRQPDPAAEKLVTVLEELKKIYLVIESEFARYLSLEFDPSIGFQEERAALLTLEGGQLETRMSEARGHCHKIANIYHKYLNPWFQKMVQDYILSQGEADMLLRIFEDLSVADNSIMYVLYSMAQWLTQESTDILNLVDAGNYEAANKRIKDARREVLRARRAVSRALSSMLELQADFIDMSGIV